MPYEGEDIRMEILWNQVNQMKVCLKKLQDEAKPVILYGASLCGKMYLNILQQNFIDVQCFCDDDKKKQGTNFCGLPVLPLEGCPQGGHILISSFGPQKLYERLQVLDKALAERVIWTDFYLWENGMDYYTYYMEHEEEIWKAYLLLADEKSKKVFRNLLQYKISRDRHLIEEIKDDVLLQYFDPAIVHFGTKDIFLDLGAYNGDTVQAFFSHAKEYKKIVALEPDGCNFRKLLENTKNIKNVYCYPYGVSQQDGVIKFNESFNWTSAADENGNTEIKVCSVDSLLRGDAATFIKADIEGMEAQMLMGAKETIQTYHPTLAIAAYHKKEDIFSLLHLLHSYYGKYKFYMRHYTDMPIDTVLYACEK